MLVISLYVFKKHICDTVHTSNILLGVNMKYIEYFKKKIYCLRFQYPPPPPPPPHTHTHTHTRTHAHTHTHTITHMSIFIFSIKSWFLCYMFPLYTITKLISTQWPHRVILKLICVHFRWNCPRENATEPTGGKSTLVQVLARCREAASHYLDQCSSRYVAIFRHISASASVPFTNWDHVHQHGN